MCAFRFSRGKKIASCLGMFKFDCSDSNSDVEIKYCFCFIAEKVVC